MAGLSEKYRAAPFRLVKDAWPNEGYETKSRSPVQPHSVDQPQLLLPSLDQLIECDHLVWVVNAAIEQLDLRPLLAQYPGVRTSSYQPQILLKGLVCACCSVVYS